jgi:hypothetical protein
MVSLLTGIVKMSDQNTLSLTFDRGIFMNTRNSVERLSEGKQRPWEEARLKGVFHLK